jgi:hypothetical protein
MITERRAVAGLKKPLVSEAIDQECFTITVARASPPGGEDPL